ncbi:MAG: prepilin peptidase [Patescibacteria group bacterium]
MFYSILLIIFVFFFGAAIGSFIAASVYRMANRQPIAKGRSECVFCRYRLTIFDLIPIISFLVLRGKCRKCGAPIDRGDFFVEIIAGILFILPVLFYWNELFLARNYFILVLRDWIFLGSLLFLFLYDLKYRILPDIISIPVTIVLFVINALLGFKILNLLLAVAIGGGFFLLQYLLSRGKWIGDGDIRLGALLGAGVGFPGILLAIFMAYILGAFAGLYLLLSKKAALKSEIAFGTFLAIGGAVAIFWGNKIINWYLNII